MRESGDYLFNDRDKLFAQNGWMQADIAELKKNQITKADLLAMEARLDKAAMAREEKRSQVLKGQIEDAFRFGIPGTEQIVRREVKEIQEQDQKQFDENLKRSGLEYKDDGSIGQKIHPIRRALVKNSQFVLFGLGVAAVANPDQAFTIVRLGLSYII